MASRPMDADPRRALPWGAFLALALCALSVAVGYAVLGRQRTADAFEEAILAIKAGDEDRAIARLHHAIDAGEAIVPSGWVFAVDEPTFVLIDRWTEGQASTKLIAYAGGIKAISRAMVEHAGRSAAAGDPSAARKSADVLKKLRSSLDDPKKLPTWRQLANALRYSIDDLDAIARGQPPPAE